MKKLDRIFLIINWVYLMGIVVLAVLSFMAGHLIIPTAWVIWGADWVCCPQILNDTDFETRYEYKPLEFGPGHPPYESTVKTE